MWVGPWAITSHSLALSLTLSLALSLALTLADPHLQHIAGCLQLMLPFLRLDVPPLQLGFVRV